MSRRLQASPSAPTPRRQASAATLSGTQLIAAARQLPATEDDTLVMPALQRVVYGTFGVVVPIDNLHTLTRLAWQSPGPKGLKTHVLTLRAFKHKRYNTGSGRT
ncbi:MAG TPA: hypothetical protein VMS08_02655 [Candidatus Saccharimonadia bacterium]|nr:hypothetical protein [Candidatus Saccharimonadia bacterium]